MSERWSAVRAGAQTVAMAAGAAGALLVLVTFAGSTSSAGPDPRPPPSRDPTAYTVCLQPLGDHDAHLLGPVGRGIGQAYGFTVRTLAARPLPEAAYYPPRKRYRADRLLEHLAAEVVPGEPGCSAVVGFTAVDVSTTKDSHVDWGVLGLAYLDGKVAVVSSFRMKRGASARRIAQRAVKVVNHELGHVIGMDHHDGGAACIMNDARGSVATIDDERGTLCAGERAIVEAKLGLDLPGRTRLDWDYVIDGR